MNHLRRILPAMVVLISVCAFADNISFTNLNANFTIQPNLGVGGNVNGTIFGQGINVSEDGGFGGTWFFGPEFPFAPGSVWSGGSGDTFMLPDVIGGTIGSQFYPAGTLGGGMFILYTSSFTFPMNGQSFTITQPASLSTFFLFDCTHPTCQDFTLATNPGKLTMSFYYDPAFNNYQFAGGAFTTVPEPGTLGLMATGLGMLTCLGYKWNWVS